MCVLLQSDREREREVSRDARSVAKLATLSLDLAPFQTPIATFFFLSD